MKILVTGGAGYIGSTICSALADEGHTPIILDSLVTGNPLFARNHEFFQGDIADKHILENIKEKHPDLRTVIHCAARIVVSESVQSPLLYYRENISKGVDFLENCLKYEMDRLLFSSSASIYDTTNESSVAEDSKCAPGSPYAYTKLVFERIIEDLAKASSLRAISLRYFNPIGADPKFRSGPFLKDPTHLLGRLQAVSSSKNPSFTIFGDDWPTRDGSPMRDFIHVWDLAMAHVRAVELLSSNRMKEGEHKKINVGTGTGTTVKEFVEMFRNISSDPIEVRIGDRRLGDIAGAFASTALAEKELRWTAMKTIQEGIADSLNWRSITGQKAGGS